MRIYAERTLFKPYHLRVLRDASAYVARVSDRWGNELRCHELARAVLRKLQGLAGELALHEDHLVLYDGKCGPVEHTWIEFASGVILDVYVPGRLPSVQLADRFVGQYKDRTIRDDIRVDVIEQLLIEMEDDRHDR